MKKIIELKAEVITDYNNINLLIMLSIIIFILFIHEISGASTFDVFGCGSRGIAMGNAQTGLSDDWCAPFYNPAGITRNSVTVGGGFIYGFDNLRIDSFGDANGTNGIERTFGLNVGVTHNFSTNFFRFGVGIYTPLDRVQLQKTHFVDEREAFFSNQLHYELYGERTQRQIILPVVALKLFDWLSIGGGVSLFISSRTDSYVYLNDIFDQSNIYMNISNTQKYTYSPDLGVLVSPLEKLNVGLSYMGEDDFPIIGTSNVEVPQLKQEFIQEIKQIVFYTPHRLSLGAAYSLFDSTLITFDLVWYGWSHYRDNHGMHPDPKWRDTVSPRVGIEHKLFEWVTIRGGFYFEPSPVPDQTGRQNYVDNDKEVFSIGVGLPFKLSSHPCEANVHFQYQQFNKRKTIKDQEYDADPDREGVQNPGFPGYESSGALFSTGVDVGYKF